MYESLESFPLRKINFVKTRTTILKAVSHLLKDKDFNSITVDEICQRAQISRGTFFNYFSTKEHVFHYYLRIFTIRIALRIKQWDKNVSFKDKMSQIYEWCTEDSSYVKFLDSYINFALTVGEDQNEMKLTDAEFVYFFSGIDEEEHHFYNQLTLYKIFEFICEDAKKTGELKTSFTARQDAYNMIGVLVATYLTNHMDESINHFDIFSSTLETK